MGRRVHRGSTQTPSPLRAVTTGRNCTAQPIVGPDAMRHGLLMVQVADTNRMIASSGGPERTTAPVLQESKASAPDARFLRRATAAADVARQPKKIVVGYDASDAADRALERAAALADDQTKIVVVASEEPYPHSGITIPANYNAAEVKRRRNDLNEARRFLSERGVEAETSQARGNPAEILVHAARDADLLVVGSRKLNRLERLVLGSVSSKVVHAAACDVLVVR